FRVRTAWAFADGEARRSLDHGDTGRAAGDRSTRRNAEGLAGGWPRFEGALFDGLRRWLRVGRGRAGRQRAREGLGRSSGSDRGAQQSRRTRTWLDRFPDAPAIQDQVRRLW